MCPWTQSLLFASNQFCGAVASSDFSNVDPFCSCVGAGLASIEFDSRGHVRREFFFDSVRKNTVTSKRVRIPSEQGLHVVFGCWMLLGIVNSFMAVELVWTSPSLSQLFNLITPRSFFFSFGRLPVQSNGHLILISVRLLMHPIL